MREFKTYHPVVNFVYFAAVIVFSCFFMHPICLAFSLICAFTYSVMLKGKSAAWKNLMYMLPLIAASALINPAFNHEGVTIITYLPSGNPLTEESIVYGVCAAAMIAGVICWLSCCNEIMTSDKLIYLFGKTAPHLSLVFSMTLRFVPRFVNQFKAVAASQRGIGRDVSDGGIFARAKNGLCILSIVVTWALENAIETADSMKSRGYGLPGRTAFSIFTFDKRDKKALFCIAALVIYIIVGAAAGKLYFRFFPSVKGAAFSVYTASVFVCYILLCAYPIITELIEVRRWKI